MKLGTTSWLTGGDFLADARLVAGRVDFVELLVYTWDREMQARVAASLDALAALDLEYTLHLPTDSAAGAKGVGRPLDERDRWLAARIGPALRERGMLFVGLDVIGGFVTEINVTSPTGVRELDRQFGLDIAGSLMDAIARRRGA